MQRFSDLVRLYQVWIALSLGALGATAFHVWEFASLPYMAALAVSLDFFRRRGKLCKSS